MTCKPHPHVHAHIHVCVHTHAHPHTHLHDLVQLNITVHHYDVGLTLLGYGATVLWGTAGVQANRKSAALGRPTLTIVHLPRPPPHQAIMAPMYAICHSGELKPSMQTAWYGSRPSCHDNEA